MSVEPVVRKGGTVYRVRWRDASGAARSKVIGRKRDADAFDAEVKREKRLGSFALSSKAEMKLREFHAEWEQLYASAHLADRTRRSYAGVWANHVEPYLGARRLSDLTTLEIERWTARLREKTGDAMVYRAVMLLQGILQRAVEWGYLPHNAAKAVRKPKYRRQRAVRALDDASIRRLLNAGKRKDRLIVAFMAYAGLRPEELRALTWADVRDNTIVVDKAAEHDGSAKETKTSVTRTVPVEDDLATAIEWVGAGTGLLLVNPKHIDGERGWADYNWDHWVQGRWQKICREAGVVGVRPYDLRHTYVSRLIHRGCSVVEVARRAGHTPEVALGIYAHEFEEAA